MMIYLIDIYNGDCRHPTVILFKKYILWATTSFYFNFIFYSGRLKEKAQWFIIYKCR